MQVHHIAIIASDYKRSKSFYTEVLQFSIVLEVFREETQSFKLDLRNTSGVQLELFSFPDSPKRPTRPEACGLRHLAFGVEDLDSEIQRLLMSGVETEPVRIDPYTNKRFTFFSDPDGLPLELYEDDSSSS